MKSSATSAVAVIVSCILVLGCAQTRQSSASTPPATTYQVVSFELQDNGRSQTIQAASVNANFFQSAHVPPLLGRGFLPEEYSLNRQRVVMVSWGFWQQQFGGDPRIIGSTLHLNGQAFTVVGVMPRNFDFPSGVAVWVPNVG